MRTISLYARHWLSPSDFYDALLSALGAPEWHGRNVNALIDSMIFGEINNVEPPYRVEVSGLSEAADAAAEELTHAFTALGSEGAIVEIASDIAWLEIDQTQMSPQTI